jgi:4-alpha-glucanotransferase
MSRRAGVLIPLFSIRAGGRSWGLGEIPDLVPFARWAARAGFSVVQILPVNEPSGGQASPYSACTSFALDPVYIALEDVEDFHAAGGVAALAADLQNRLVAARAAERVRWEDIRPVKQAALRVAYERFVADSPGTPRAAALEAFAHEEADWLDEYCLFSALHDEQGDKAWTDWPAPLRDRDPAALAAARERLADAIAEKRYVQWLANVQWHAACDEAKRSGVELMGDLPFLVSGDSSDIWSRADEFRLDLSTGVPPDAFSVDGQDWGLPVFRWDVMARTGHVWMRSRARRAADLYGLFRVDHVVGLYRTFYRPASGPHNGPGKFTPEDEPDQIRLGEYNLTLLDGRLEGAGGRVIAEDLGVVPDFVRTSLRSLGIPGYRVLRWEKDGSVFRDPARWPSLSVGTTGTHDTEPMSEWFDALDEDERRAFLDIPALSPLRARFPRQFDVDVRDAILACVYGSGSDLILLPFMDAFGAHGRVNVPGTVNAENWTYRMPVDIAAVDDVDRLSGLAERSGRLGR